jgi:hypothetical protein
MCGEQDPGRQRSAGQAPGDALHQFAADRHKSADPQAGDRDEHHSHYADRALGEVSNLEQRSEQRQERQGDRPLGSMTHCVPMPADPLLQVDVGRESPGNDAAKV